MRFLEDGENWLIVAGELEEWEFLGVRPMKQNFESMREALTAQYPDRRYMVMDHGTIIAVRRLPEKHWRKDE